MNLAHALRISPPKPFTDSFSENFASRSNPKKLGGRIAVVGAGGKTTTIFQLARELPSPVLVTSTTHFGIWQTSLADKHIVAEEPDDIVELPPSGVTLLTGPFEGDRTAPLDATVIKDAEELARYRGIPLLIECHGSRNLPLKAPAEHEPSIPNFVDTVIVVAGLSGLYQPLEESHVHRPRLFSALSGLEPGKLVTPESVVRVLLHPEGGLKNIPAGACRVCLLNQADTPELQAIAQQLSGSLLESYDSVVIASLKDKVIYAVNERVAGIVLAAGESARFGKPKQLLDWHGEPFVHAVAKKALRAGLSPVVVVTGANADEVEAVIKDLDVTIVRNESWRNGQGLSIAKGVESLPGNIGASIFLLADQPQVSVEVLRTLIESHRRELPAIVAPLILEERRGNPVLFDRVTFPDLLSLQGDVGGRAIFHKHKVEYLPWHDDALLLDVDTPEDYQRLIDSM